MILGAQCRYTAHSHTRTRTRSRTRTIATGWLCLYIICNMYFFPCRFLRLLLYYNIHIYYRRRPTLGDCVGGRLSAGGSRGPKIDRGRRRRRRCLDRDNISIAINKYIYIYGLMWVVAGAQTGFASDLA